MDFRYPIGRPQFPEVMEERHLTAWIQDMMQSPELLRDAVQGLNADQLDTPYRPDGWTVRQVVHHLPDSHMVAYVNFRMGLTEDSPTVKPVNINEWATLPDARGGDIGISLELFNGIQRRWVSLLKEMSVADFQRTIEFPKGGPRSLAAMLCIYSWHGKHHVAHITSLRDRMGWN